MEQIGIAICGVTAVFLSQDSRADWRKWACVFGLIGQPFWFYTAYIHAQWGILALSFLYAFSWARGFKNNWLTVSPAQKGGAE